MTAAAKPKATRGSRSRKAASAGELPPTLGPRICAWIERYLVHGQGDRFGQPFQLRTWQKALIYRAYELAADGRRLWRQVLWGLPKGNGKTELAAAVAIAELAGPVVFAEFRDGQPLGKLRSSPDIPVAAASFDQADLLFGAARTMVREGPLNDFCEVYDTEILLRGRPGRLYRIAAVAGTNDGARPSFGVHDEVHEWTGNRERVHLVLQNNLAKRAGTWGLDISTAGWDPRSLLGRAYARGKRIEAGEEPADGFLMHWFEGPADLDLDDPKQFERACQIANPALGDFLQLEALRARFRDTPEHEFRRYHLNQWVGAPIRWLPVGAWDACVAAGPEPAAGAPVVLALDGTFNRGAVGLIGCSMAAPQRLFVRKYWTRESSDPLDWAAPSDQVQDEIRKACAHWRVQAVALNEQKWPEVFTALGPDRGGLPIVSWKTHVVARMAQACAQFHAAVTEKRLRQDGHAELAAHLGTALVRTDARGTWILPDDPSAERCTVLATAAVMAYDMALRQPNTTSVYETRGPEFL